MKTQARLLERVEVTAYYVVSEAPANTVKHASGSAGHVDVAVTDGVVRLIVEDDGIGGVDPTRGSGLVGLKDRVEATGGTMLVPQPPWRWHTPHRRNSALRRPARRTLTIDLHCATSAVSWNAGSPAPLSG